MADRVIQVLKGGRNGHGPNSVEGVIVQIEKDPTKPGQQKVYEWLTPTEAETLATDLRVYLNLLPEADDPRPWIDGHGTRHETDGVPPRPSNDMEGWNCGLCVRRYEPRSVSERGISLPGPAGEVSASPTVVGDLPGPDSPEHPADRT